MLPKDFVRIPMCVYLAKCLGVRQYFKAIEVRCDGGYGGTTFKIVCLYIFFFFYRKNMHNSILSESWI